MSGGTRYLTAGETACARGLVYRWFSLAFGTPGPGTFAELTGPLGEAAAGALGALEPEPAVEVDPVLAMLRASPAEGLEAEHRRCLGHTLEVCPPYEAQYGCADVFQQAQLLGDIAGFYTAFGLRVSGALKDRHDHLAVELEFMYVLAAKEAYAAVHHGAEAAALCREAQQVFLRDHLGRWAPLFCRRLMRRAGSGVYRELALALEAFLAAEASRLGVEVVPLDEITGRSVAFTPEGAGFRGPAPA